VISFCGCIILRIEQRAVPGFDKQSVIPATEFIGADLDKIGVDELSFHFYGWGKVDLADKSTAEGDTDGDLSYAYLLYRAPKANGQVKLGRFFVYEGVAAEQLDGIGGRVDLPAGFALSLYGGAPVKTDQNNNKGDALVGGRIGYRFPSILEVGASALYEKRTATGVSTDLKDYRGLFGGDIWFSPIRIVEVRGHTYYNYATSGVAEHSYRASLTPVKGLTITGEYNENHFKDYFASTNLRSLFNPDNGGEMKSYGGIVSLTIAKPLEITADYRRYNRSSDVITATQGNSNRYGGEVRLSLLGNKSRSGISYHRSEADNSGFNLSYHEVHGYTMYDADRFIASLDAIGHFYKEKIFNEDRAYELVGSLGYKFTPGLVLSGDLSYGQNPRLNDDLRGVLRLAYNFNTYESKGATK
jgi:hypothetical protein